MGGMSVQVTEPRRCPVRRPGPSQIKMYGLCRLFRAMILLLRPSELSGRRKYHTRCDRQFVQHISHTRVFSVRVWVEKVPQCIGNWRSPRASSQRRKRKRSTVNPEYFVCTQFSYPGLSDLSYAWNFRTVADRCGYSDLLCTFHMHSIFVRKPLRTKYTKITCIRNILDLQYSKKKVRRRTEIRRQQQREGKIQFNVLHLHKDNLPLWLR